MAMNDESEYPRLTPPDDRFASRDRLLRRPEDLTFEQFDLLAAEWSEGTLSGDHLSELDEAMAADPSMKVRAESFRMVRLVPYNDMWPGRNRLLKTSPATTAIRRTIFMTLTSAAAVVAFIMFGPSVIKQGTEKTTAAPPVTTEMAEVLIPEAHPIIISVKKVDASAVSARATTGTWPTEHILSTEITKTSESTGITAIAREAGTIPVDIDHSALRPQMIAAAGNISLRPMEMNPVAGAPLPSSVSEELPADVKESNWVFRGVSALAKAITKEENKIDGYVVASACVKGINNALGWEMELERASNKNGNPVAVNFSSSLLSFSAPVNKNSP